MAGRRSSKIKVLTHREESLFRQLANTGVCTSEQAKSLHGINQERLMKVSKSGYITVEPKAIRGSEQQNIVRLTDKGKKFCKAEYGIKNLYKSDDRQLRHDLRLTESYCMIIKEHPDAVWKTEKQLIEEYKKETGETLENCVDAVCEYDGQSIAIEAIGDKYSSQTIQVKERIGKMFADKVVKI